MNSILLVDGKNPELQGKFKLEKSLIKWQSQIIKHINRMDNNEIAVETNETRYINVRCFH